MKLPSTPKHLTELLCALLLAWTSPSARCQSAGGTCAVTGSSVVASAQQRRAAARLVGPRGVIGPSGFAWPDTELGIVKQRGSNGYLFFSSDGGCHLKCNQSGERDGSITRSIGTLDNPLGSGSPITETLLPQTAQLANNDIVYVGGGAVYRVPAGHPGAGSLLLAYQAARVANPRTHDGQYGFIGLAKSTNEGAAWTSLGLIIGANQHFDPKANPAVNQYDIGNGNLIADPTGTYLYIYFPDKIAPVAPGGKSLNTYFSVARVGMDDLLSAAFAPRPPVEMPRFTKLYKGQWNQPGIFGLSSMVLPGPYPTYAGDNFVTYSDYLHRYIAIFDDTQNISYAESIDGVTWTMPVLLKSFKGQKVSAEYAVAVGKEADPSRLGQQFYIFFTDYPTNGTGWNAATLQRLSVSCKAAPPR